MILLLLAGSVLGADLPSVQSCRDAAVEAPVVFTVTTLSSEVYRLYLPTSRENARVLEGIVEPGAAVITLEPGLTRRDATTSLLPYAFAVVADIKHTLSTVTGTPANRISIHVVSPGCATGRPLSWSE